MNSTRRRTEAMHPRRICIGILAWNEEHSIAQTIESLRQRLMNKLQIHSIAELTKFAIREGLTTLEPTGQ
jgi:hypothetical protein